MTQEELELLLRQFKEALDQLGTKEDRIIEELVGIRGLLQQYLRVGQTQPGGETLEELCGELIELVQGDLLSNQGNLERELQKASHLMDGFWPDDDEDGKLYS